MLYPWATLLALLNTIWLGTVVVGLPGNWLMILSTILLAWWRGGDEAGDSVGMFSLTTIVVIVVIAAGAEVAEFLTGVIGSKKAGGTRWGSVGALIGGIIGAVIGTIVIPIPLLGSLIGASGGACLGAWALELHGGRSMKASIGAGVGAGVGTLAGRVIKLVAGIVIWLTVTVAAFWP